MLGNAAVMAVGAAVTISTYDSVRETGGTYFILHGALAFGALGFLGCLLRYAFISPKWAMLIGAAATLLVGFLVLGTDLDETLVKAIQEA